MCAHCARALKPAPREGAGIGCLETGMGLARLGGVTRLTRFAPRPTLLFALLSLALAVRAGTAAAKPKPRLEAAAGKLEVDAKKLARSKILRRGDFRKLGSAKVRLGTGPAVSLGTIARRVFADQRALARGLRQAKGVQGKVRVVETAIERKDAYELTLSTTAVVSDPDKVTKKVPRLARWKVASRRSPSQLEPKQRKAFDQWVRGDLKRLPASHPLRRAYDRGGEKALVAAMVAGKGTYTFEQTLIVPRAMPSLRAAKLKPPRKPKRLKPKRIQRRRIKRSVDPMQTSCGASSSATRPQTSIPRSSGERMRRAQQPSRSCLARFARAELRAEA